MLGRVAEIPIANAFSELVEIDFVDYGDYASFLHIRDIFSRFPLVVFTWGEEKGGPTIGNAPLIGDFALVSGVFGAWNYCSR